MKALDFLKKYSYQGLMLILGLIGAGLAILGPRLLPALYAQDWCLWTMALGAPFILGVMPLLPSSLKERAKIALFILIVMGFILSLNPFAKEVAYYAKAFLYYVDKAGSYWEGYLRLTQLFERAYPKMADTWLIWGGVTGGFLMAIILSIAPLLSQPLKFLNPDDRSTKGEGPWKGGFMEASHINYLKKNTTGLPLGHYKGAVLRYKSSHQEGWLGGHHAVFAGSRAGKGVSCVIPAILDHDGPVFCIDIKGENFAVTKKYRESLGRRVIVLNPFSVIEKSVDSFNPLDYIRLSHLSRDLYVVAEGMVKPEPGVNSHFSDLVRDLLSAAVEVCLKSSPAASLNEVAAIVNSQDFGEHLKKWAGNPRKFGERPASIANAFLAAGDKEQGSIITTVQRNTNWMAEDGMKRLLKISSFNLEDLIANKIDLFIVVPMDVLKQQEIYLRLLTNLLLGLVFRQDGRSKVEKPILMVLDEFTRLGRVEKFLDIVTVGAGCGIEAMFIAQDKGQVDDVWGEKNAGTILGSCATVRAFGLGRTDSVTSRWIDEQIGFQTVLAKSKREGKKDQDSYSEHRDKILTSTEVSEMGANEMLCFIRSHKILKLDRIIYYEDKEYKNKIDGNPLV